MSNLQIKNVPDDVHAELRRRADQRGLTQRDYVLELIREDQTLPSKVDWLAELDGLPRARTTVSAADAVREAREEREQHLVDVHRRRVRDR